MSLNKLGGNVTKKLKERIFMISIGIDVSKGKSTVCFLKPGGEVLKTPFEVSHTKNALMNWWNVQKITMLKNATNAKISLVKK